MHCPLCRLPRLVTIRINVNDRRLALHSCSQCETRWWDRDGSNIGFDDVLETAARRAS